MPKGDVAAPQSVPISKIRESKTNPRKTFGNLSELAESIKRQGILQPLLARKSDDGFELVFGHRRFRAAKQAGLKQVPVVLRDMSDAEVLEAQLVENLQRLDIHPLEEAEGYDRLQKEYGYSGEQVAERVGKSKAYVYASLKLLDLGDEARKAFYAGKLNASTALLVARLKGERLQNQALDAITKTDKRGDAMSYREAANYVQKHFGEKKIESKQHKARETKQQQNDLRRETGRVALERIVGIIERKASLEPNDIRAMLLALLDTSLADAALARRGFESSTAAAAAVQKKLRPEQLRSLLFEIAVTTWVDDQGDEYTPQLKSLAKAYGVDLRELEHTIRERNEARALREEAEQLFKK